jgi:hypothetical protein
VEVSQRDPAQAGSHWPLACTAKKPVSTGSTRIRVSRYKRCGAITLDTLVLWRHPSPVPTSSHCRSDVRGAPEPQHNVQTNKQSKRRKRREQKKENRLGGVRNTGKAENAIRKREKGGAGARIPTVRPALRGRRHTGETPRD